jgi:hypothetical protein
MKTRPREAVPNSRPGHRLVASQGGAMTMRDVLERLALLLLGVAIVILIDAARSAQGAF